MVTVTRASTAVRSRQAVGYRDAAASAPELRCLRLGQRTHEAFRHAVPVVADSDIITHDNPVWRGRTNFIVRLDLSPHGAPGRWEQLWTRTDDEQSFVVCCIPYFTYGISLGDTLSVERATGAHRVKAKSGHRTIRVALTDDDVAHQKHDRLHAQLSGELGCLVEFRGAHYAAVNIADDQQQQDVMAVLTPMFDRGRLLWEWADPPGPPD